MSLIRDYINNNLMDPLKQYPTAIQDTLISIIADRLEELYDLAVRFPEITNPSADRLDILKIIADQFLFTIRTDAELQEQIDILDHILYIYDRRGSIDTIENMWKYYGGELPKDVHVRIPADSLFTWGISKYSGTHVFEDSDINKAGVYEVILNNNRYPVPELKTFMLDELVTAGTSIFFKDLKHSEITEDATDTYFRYLALNTETVKSIFEIVSPYSHEMIYSGTNDLVLSGKSINSSNPLDEDPLTVLGIPTRWSGSELIEMLVTQLKELESPEFSMIVYDFENQLGPMIDSPSFIYLAQSAALSTSQMYRVYYTPSTSSIDVSRYLINSADEVFIDGYFILGGESNLGEMLYRKVGVYDPETGKIIFES